MLAGKVVREVGTFAAGEQILFVALGIHLVGLIACDQGRRFGLIALQIPDAAVPPDLVPALPREVIELLTDVPK
jgi:hypothetical protein